MTYYSNSLVRIAATVVVVANVITAGLIVLDDSAAGALIAVGIATLGPVLILLANVTRTAWVLPAFVTSLVGLGAAVGSVGLGALASGTLVVALVVAFLACVAGTLVQAQGALEEPTHRF